MNKANRDLGAVRKKNGIVTCRASTDAAGEGKGDPWLDPKLFFELH